MMNRNSYHSWYQGQVFKHAYHGATTVPGTDDSLGASTSFLCSPNSQPGFCAMPCWAIRQPSETVFWDLFLGSKNILKPELAAPAFLSGHFNWNPKHPPNNSSAARAPFLVTRDPGPKLKGAIGGSLMPKQQ